MDATDRLRHFASLAVADERIGARWFYHEANRFCSWLAGVSGLDTKTVAGVVSALSPRNSWEANQLDAIGLCMGGEPRDGAHYGAMPRDQRIAQRIIHGEDAETALRGPKVSAFFRNLWKPDEDVGIPIDRHLGRALWGRRISDAELSRRATNGYRGAEEVFEEAADKEGIRPIEFANLVWFVLRRLSRQNGQHALDHHPIRWRPFYPGGEYRYRPMYSPKMDLLDGCPWRPWLNEVPLAGPRFGHETREERRGRVRVHLAVGHRYANSAGWQWRYRLVMAYELGEVIRSDEHVDHINEIVDDDRAENLRLLAVDYHGRLHASAAELEGRNVRGVDGRFVAHRKEEGPSEFWVNRMGPVVSSRPIDPSTWLPRARTLKEAIG